MPELVVILVVALVVLGPQRLPEVARTLGKALAEFRRQTSEVMEEFQVQALLDDERPRPKPAASVPPPAAAATGAPPAPAVAAAPAGTTPHGTTAEPPASDPGPDRPV